MALEKNLQKANKCHHWRFSPSCTSWKINIKWSKRSVTTS